MSLSIGFRWATPNVETPKSEWQKQGWSEGLTQTANAIVAAKDRRYRKEQDARRNKIEDEDRSRRISEEERRKKVYGEAADLMRKREAEINALKGQREQIVQKINQLRSEIGGM